MTAGTKRLVQIRSYALKAGRSAAFHDLFVTRSLPLLDAAGIEVVAFGPSAHDPDAWFLIRAFADLAQLNEQEDAFYASDAWRQGPREAILDCIDRYLDTLLWLSRPAIEDMRASNARPPRCHPGEGRGPR